MSAVNSSSPLLSVIMTNYNTPEDFLRQAIESILNQSFSDFEFIIVDDASTDPSLSIIESYHDDRIILLKNTENIGLTKSLNKALAVCKGDFIARMDSDDISEPERFEKQVDFMSDHPDVIVCGTWAKLIGDWQKTHSNEIAKRKIPSSEEFKIYQLFSNNPNIVHPSAMFNKKLLLENGIKYDERFIYSQDYKMWIECNRVAKCAIVEEVLLEYRVHGNAISTSKKEIQDDCVQRIIEEQLKDLHLTLSNEIKDFHIQLLTSRKPYDKHIKKWIDTLIIANRQYRVYDQKLFKKLLLNKWTEICYFGIASQSGFFKKLSALLSVPINKIPYFFGIRSNRKHKKKDKVNG